MATITALPNRATAAEAKGIFPPLLRAVTHVGFMLALVHAQTDENRTPVADDALNTELLGEIDHLADHWALVLRPAYLSQDTRDALNAITDMVTVIHESITTDDRPTLFRNLQAFLRSIVSAGVLIYTSAFGLRNPEDTDAGTAL